MKREAWILKLEVCNWETAYMKIDIWDLLLESPNLKFEVWYLKREGRSLKVEAWCSLKLKLETWSLQFAMLSHALAMLCYAVFCYALQCWNLKPQHSLAKQFFAGLAKRTASHLPLAHRLKDM